MEATPVIDGELGLAERVPTDHLVARRYEVAVLPGVVNFKGIVLQRGRSSNLVALLDHRNLVESARSTFKPEVGPIDGVDWGEMANPRYLAGVSPLPAQRGDNGCFHYPFHGAPRPVVGLLDRELLAV